MTLIDPCPLPDRTRMNIAAITGAHKSDKVPTQLLF